MDEIPYLTIEWFGGNCPAPWAEGFYLGKPFYFRARVDAWSFNLGGKDVISNPEWRYFEYYEPKNLEPEQNSAFAAGWITRQEGVGFILKSIFEYEGLKFHVGDVVDFDYSIEYGGGAWIVKSIILNPGLVSRYQYTISNGTTTLNGVDEQLLGKAL